MAKGHIRGPLAHGCAGKFRYADIATARRHLYGLIREEKSPDNKRLNAYRCPYCSGFHVGHRQPC